MRNRLTEPERQLRAALDGRVAFISAAIALGAGLILLLDRIGLPESGARWLALLIAILAIVLIGLAVRAARVSTFYAAGRTLPASYAGLAFAAGIAGMGLAFLPPLPVRLPGMALVLGLALGVTGICLFSAPLLRKSGAFSAADLVAARFPSPLSRICFVVLAAAICGATALAGFEQALRLLETHLGASRSIGAAITGATLVLALVPGGLRGLTWSGAAAGGMLLAALALPVVLVTSHDVPLPSPMIGSAEAWSHSAERISAWAYLSDDAYRVWLAAPIALGLIGFAPLLAFVVTCRDRIGAQFALGAGATWTLLIAFFAVMTLALTAIGLDVALIGQRADRLPDIFYKASTEGWLSICGQHVAGPAQARAACAAVAGHAGVLRPEDFSATTGFLLFGLADAQGLGGAWRALAIAGWYAASVALAAAGLQGAATALGHDLLYRMRDRAVIASRRLATTRLMLVAAIGLTIVATARQPADPRLFLGIALAVSAAGMTPLLALSLWPRAGNREALLALAAGLIAVTGVTYDGLRYGLMAPEALGLGALAGAVAALAAGFLVSLRPGASRDHGAAFRDRMLTSGADALTPDRSA